MQKVNKVDTHGIQIGKKAKVRQANGKRNLRKASSGIKRMMQLMSASNRRAKSGLRVFHKKANQQQRVAVRMTYVKAKSPGHWKAHGAYLQREAAAGKEPAGFSSEQTGMDIPAQLDSWQRQGDQRLWRVIISPEEGENLDLLSYTRDVISKIERDLATKLEWVAVVHRNTDHPHVHVAIRGIKDDGSALSFEKQYVKEGVRSHAQQEATRHLGYRSPEAVENSLIQEATKDRMTSLDRFIQKNAVPYDLEAKTLVFDVSSPIVQQYSTKDVSRLFAIERRLYYLESLGLAQRGPGDQWQLPGDYLATLKALAIAGDKQRMLTRHMEPASSVGQAIVSAKWSDIRHLEARVLGHGEDEATGKRFMLLERLDGTIIHLPHRSDTEARRANKELARNQVITISRDRGRLVIEEHGNAERILQNPAALSRLSGVQSVDTQRPGWLGRLDVAAASVGVRARSTEARNEPPAPQPLPKLFAIRLTDEQLRSLILEKYPHSEEERNNALAAIHDPEKHVRLTDRGIEIQYSPGTKSYFAEVSPRDKTYLDARLTELSATTARRRQDRQRDRERE